MASPLRLLLIFAACACGLAHAADNRNLSALATTGAKRVALVIGNDAYQRVSKLEKAGNDATAMARELKAAGFDVLLHRDLNYRGMVKAVETLANSITGGDQVVVFFAGHGVQIKSGSYLLPIDIEASSESEVEKTAYGGMSDFLCVRREETFPRCCLPKVPLDRRRAARWESRWSF